MDCHWIYIIRNRILKFGKFKFIISENVFTLRNDKISSHFYNCKYISTDGVVNPVTLECYQKKIYHIHKFKIKNHLC